MKKTILILTLLFGVSIFAHAELAVATPPVAPAGAPDVNTTMPQAAPTEAPPAINKTDNDGSGDDADTLNDPDPEADDRDEGTMDAGEAPAQKL